MAETPETEMRAATEARPIESFIFEDVKGLENFLTELLDLFLVFICLQVIGVRHRANFAAENVPRCRA